MWGRDIAGSVQTWEISACGEGILVGSVQTWEICAYGVGILLAVLRGTRSSVSNKELDWE